MELPIHQCIRKDREPLHEIAFSFYDDNQAVRSCDVEIEIGATHWRQRSIITSDGELDCANSEYSENFLLDEWTAKGGCLLLAQLME